MAESDSAGDVTALGAGGDETVVVPDFAVTQAAELAWSEVDDSLPPAGWYADPENAGRTRYWDGTAWAAPPNRMSDSARWAVAAAAIVGALIIGAILSTTPGKDQKAVPPTVPASSSPAMVPAMRAGQWYRIDDCLLCDARRPGVYETRGAVDIETMIPCSWRRNTKPSGDLSYVIALGKVDAGEGVGRVTLNPGEYFYSQGCYPWYRIG